MGILTKLRGGTDDVTQKSTDDAMANLYEEEGLMRAGAHDIGSTIVKTPTSLATQGRKGVVGLAGVAGGTYTLSQGADWLKAKDQKEAYQSLQDRINAIQNNPNLSAEEKAQRIAEARRLYREQWVEKDDGGSILGMLGLDSGNDTINTLIIGFIIVSAIWAAPKLMRS